MIRREMNDEAGSPTWLLISQVDHAKLAADLAHAWHVPLVDEPDAQRQLLATIEHHDDGWREWETSLKVDAVSGRPLQFTEMPLADSLEIWQRSIDECREFGELAGWLVAGHFEALLRHSNAWQKTTHPASAAAQAFLARNDAARQEWMSSWNAHQLGPSSLPDRALKWLQFFDYFSLWLCCAERQGTDRLAGVDREQVVFQAAGVDIALLDWPFQGDSLCLTVAGREVTRQAYTDESLQAAYEKGPQHTLHWKLQPVSDPNRGGN